MFFTISMLLLLLFTIGIVLMLFTISMLVLLLFTIGMVLMFTISYQLFVTNSMSFVSIICCCLPLVLLLMFTIGIVLMFTISYQLLVTNSMSLVTIVVVYHYCCFLPLLLVFTISMLLLFGRSRVNDRCTGRLLKLLKSKEKCLKTALNVHMKYFTI